MATHRLIVKSHPGISHATFASTLGKHGGRVHKIIDGIDAHVVNFTTPSSKSSLIDLLAEHPHVQYVEEDKLMPATSTTNDPYFSSEWHLTKTNTPTAWDTSTGSGVIVAVCDTGVDPTHPDLAGNLVAGWNVVAGNSNTADADVHGTAVAGTIAAIGNNGIGVVGVARGAKIMPIVAATMVNGAPYAYWSDMANGITWAADHGAKVVNMSYAVAYNSSTIQSAGNYLASKGGVLVVSAGNTGAQDPSAATSSMVVVSATDANDALCSWSTFGNAVEVSAPGINIYTTWPVAKGSYAICYGTSFSAPVVASVIALMLAAKPTLTPAQIHTILQTTSVDLGTTGKDVYFGYGRVDAAAAVTAAVGATAPTDTTAPTCSITAPSNSATVSGVVTVNVNASDNIGVAKVELYVNGSLVGTDLTSPYSFTWDSRTRVDGAASLTVKAYDAAGNVGMSSAISVNVLNTGDTTPPTVTITTPANNASIPTGNVNVTATASDNVRVKSLTISIDGRAVSSTTTASSLTYKWNTKKLSHGSHVITATAVDTANNSSTTSITVTH